MLSVFINDNLCVQKDPLQDQGAHVGGFLLIPRSQPQEAGAGGGGRLFTDLMNIFLLQDRAPSGGRLLLMQTFFPHVQVKDDKAKCTLGNLTVSLSSLLAEEDMTLTQCSPLKNSGPSSTIKLKMALRVMLNSHRSFIHKWWRSYSFPAEENRSTQSKSSHSNRKDYKKAVNESHSNITITLTWHVKQFDDNLADLTTRNSSFCEEWIFSFRGSLTSLAHFK